MNTFNSKKPYNQYARKTFTSIVAPEIVQNTEKITQLFSLVEQGNVAEVKKFVLTSRVKLSSKFNNTTVLHKALLIDDLKMPEQKKLEFIRYLIENGAHVNSYDEFNVTPLHLAVQARYPTIVNELISKGANINSQTAESLTPLHYATLMNIQPCPPDNMPQDIIPKPETKSIEYNKPIKLIVKAFTDRDSQVQTISNVNTRIQSYNDNTGEPVYVGEPNPALVNKFVLDTIEFPVKQISNLFKYQEGFIKTIEEKIKNVIQDKKKDLNTFELKNILSDFVILITGQMKKKYSIEDIKEADLKFPFIEEENLDKQFNSIADNTIALVNKIIGEQLVQMIEAKIADMKDTNTNLWIRYKEQINQLVLYIIDNEKTANNFKAQVRKILEVDNDQETMLHNLIKESIEIISEPISNFQANIDQINSEIQTNKNLVRVKGYFAGNNQINNQIYVTKIVPIILGLKDSSEIKKKINWYFNLANLINQDNQPLLLTSEIVICLDLLYKYGQKEPKVFNVKNAYFNLASLLTSTVSKMREGFINLPLNQKVRLVEYCFIYWFDDNYTVNGEINIQTSTEIKNILSGDNYGKTLYAYSGYNGTVKRIDNPQLEIKTLDYSNPGTNADSIVLHKIKIKPIIEWNGLNTHLQTVINNDILKHGLTSVYGTLLSKILNVQTVKNYISNFSNSSDKPNLTIKFIKSLLDIIYSEVKQIDGVSIELEKEKEPSNPNQINEWVLNQISKYEFNKYIYPLNEIENKLVLKSSNPIVQARDITEKIKSNINISNFSSEYSNSVNRFVKMLGIQAEFVKSAKTNLELQSDDYQNITTVETFFSNKINNLITKLKEIKLKEINLINLQVGAHEYGGTTRTLKAKIIAAGGDYNAGAAMGWGPGVFFNAGRVGLGAFPPAGFNPNQQTFHNKLLELRNAIKEFRDVIKDLTNPAAPASIGSGQGYVAANLRLDQENFFPGLGGLNPGFTKNNPIIKNIYINNIALLVGLLHFAFDENPNNLAPGYTTYTNLNFGLTAAAAPAPALTSQKPLNQSDLAGRQQENSIRQLPETIYQTNFNSKATSTGLPAAPYSSLKSWLNNLHIFNANIQNNKFNGPAPASSSIESNNTNTILREDDRNNITTIPSGLLDIQQGCLINVIKYICDKINELFNSQLDENTIKNITECLEMFKSTVLLLIKYQLFCAVPSNNLYNQLVEQINKFKFSELIQIEGQHLNLINKMVNVIHQQKVLRARSVGEIVIRYLNIFNELKTRFEITDSIHSPVVQTAKSSRLIKGLLDMYYQEAVNPSNINSAKLQINPDTYSHDADENRPAGVIQENQMDHNRFFGNVNNISEVKIDIGEDKITLIIGEAPNEQKFTINKKLQLPLGSSKINFSNPDGSVRPTLLNIYMGIKNYLLQAKPNAPTPDNPIKPRVIFRINNFINGLNIMETPHPLNKELKIDLSDFVEQIKFYHLTVMKDKLDESTNFDFGQIENNELGKYSFNPSEYSGEFADADADVKRKYFTKLINKPFIRYFIADFLNKVKESFVFVSQPYYNAALEAMPRSIPNKFKHENLRKIILSTFEKIMVDLVNNLIDKTIKKVLIEATTRVIDLQVLQGLDFENEVELYLPSFDYSFGFSSFSKNLVKQLKTNSNPKITDPIESRLDLELIEQEDYNINEKLSTNEINLNSNKLYPIFYSYNYETKENNFDCVVINPEIIEMLIKKANINITDHTGKTIIDYIIEGKMYYLLTSDLIKKRLVNSLPTIISKCIEFEKSHNKLFWHSNNLVFVDNFTNNLISRLKNTQEIKSNIPINIKHIFKAFLCIQNIYWYRLCNKNFNKNSDYLAMFNINYNIISGLKLSDINDWKKIFQDIKFSIEKSSSNVARHEIAELQRTNSIDNLVYQSSPSPSTPSKIPDPFNQSSPSNQILISLEKIKKMEQSTDSIDIKLIDLNKGSDEDLPEDKTLRFFRSVFSSSANPPITYTYAWKEVKKLNLSYFIHLKMCEILNKLFEQDVFESKTQSISLNLTPKTLNKEKFEEFKKTITNIGQFIEPISEFVNGKFLNKTLSLNPMLLFQVRTIVHLLTSFIGSNMYMFIEKLLVQHVKESSEASAGYTDIYNKVTGDLEDLKKYILSDNLDTKYLTFAFVKLSMGFEVTKLEQPIEQSFDDIFSKLLELIPNNYSELIKNKIKDNVIQYYTAIYKETLDSLLNFSDSYYRFIKNQHLGILTLKNFLA